MIDRSVAPFPPNYDPSASRSKFESDFLVFHRSNPLIYWMIFDFAFEWLRSGRGICGIHLLTERVRWEMYVKTSGDVFKLNNNTCAYYARLLWELEPSLRSLFKFRKLKFPCTFGPPNDELPSSEHVT